MRLVADIGGTNTRLALSDGGRVAANSVQSFRNADHAGFAPLAAQYLRGQGGAQPDALVIAVAGPVGKGRARLTNHNWTFETADLSDRFGGASVHLLNDLSALGYAIPALQGDDLMTIAGQQTRPAPDGQALVAGIGTGFNVCPVTLRDGAVVSCQKAEFGHVSLPGNVARALRERIGAQSEAFSTVEHCFSGAGVAQLFALFNRSEATSPVEALNGNSPASAAFVGFYAGLIGQLARDLRTAFMPEAGLYFAGSIARAVLSGPARGQFSSVLMAPSGLELPPMAGVHLICDDAAALRGCAAYL